MKKILPVFLWLGIVVSIYLIFQGKVVLGALLLFTFAWLDFKMPRRKGHAM